MSHLVKRHVSHKAGMQHLSYLDSFMDETDREVMSLTDRAFKSLCIGDEAVYNDSGLSPSPVDWHKPLVNDKAKKIRERSSSDVKNHRVHPVNGITSKPWQMIENSAKLSSHFGGFPSERMDDVGPGTNGDSWDKSALLSIQKELSEFSYQNHFADEQFHYGRNHARSWENGTNKDIKNKQSKSSKLRKLNSKNSFLHSEFSAFRSWRDLKRLRLDNITQKILQNKSPAGIYKELATVNKSPCTVSGSVRETGHTSPASAPWLTRDTGQKRSTPEPQHDPEPLVCRQTAQTRDAAEPKEQTEVLRNSQPQLRTPSGSVQRCQSDGDLSAPWRRNRKVKGVIPTIRSSPFSEREHKDKGQMPIRTKVQTMEEPPSTSSTPFSILHLLTPIIPSRQGTETSEVLQALLSPLAADLPRLHETEPHRSPEIKRENYKAMASGLLFNLKDNRKRVKVMYSPPRFKPSNSSADQNKTSSMVEPDTMKDNQKLAVPEISDLKSTSPEQHERLSPPRSESTDLQKSQITPCYPNLNSRVPDDFLALSLLQDRELRSKQSPAIKSSYPSLNLYRKAALIEPESRTIHENLPVEDKEQSRAREKNQNSVQPILDEKLDLRQPEKVSTETTELRQAEADEVRSLDGEDVNINCSAVSKSPHELTNQGSPYKPNISPRKDLNANKDKMNVRGTVKGEQGPTKDTRSCRKDTKAKHSFSSRQNNYIKSQRYVNDEVEYEYQTSDQTRERISLGGRDKENVDVHHDKQLKQKTSYHLNDHHGGDGKHDLSEQRTSKKNALSMKGNTSAKIALFDIKDKEYDKNHEVPESKRDKIVMDKYQQATVALKEMIAKREQRRNRSESTSISFMETDEICGYKKQTDEEEKADRRDETTISDFNPTSQNVQSMSFANTEHGERQTAEVKLAQACEPEEHRRHKSSLIKPGEVDTSHRTSQQAEADEVCSMDPQHDTSDSTCPNELTKRGNLYQPEVPPSKDTGDSKSGEMEGNRYVIEREPEESKIAKDTDVKSNVYNEREVRKNLREVSKTLTEPSEKNPECLIQVEELKNRDSEQDIRDQKVPEQNYLFGPENDFTLDAGHEDDLHRKSLKLSANESVVNVSDHLLELGRRSNISTDLFNQFVNNSEEDRYEETPQNSESGKHDDVEKVSKLNENLSAQTFTPVNQSSDNFKESSVTNQSEESSYKTHKDSENSLVQTMDRSSASIMNSSGTPASLINKVEKQGWVQCLINSGKNRTPSSQSNASSPTMGKPALFKVKDNTFSASPVTKTVRPTLHKTVSGMTQPWSPRDSLSGSERGDEDLDIFINCLEIQSPIPQSNKLPKSTQFHPASQSTPVQKRKESLDGQVERRSAVNSVPEGIESGRTSVNDFSDELAFKTAPTERKESIAPSERSESVCSGNEHQSQNKPPTVPPKSEKALRRAMKLTSRRIQKVAETKNKSERGRSGEKNVGQSRDRRHHSSDKVLSKQSYHQEHSTDRNKNQTSADQEVLPKKQDASVRRSKKSEGPINENKKTKPEGQKEVKNITVRSDVDADVSGERPGRMAEKYLPNKVSRRAQSLDRFSHGKPHHNLSNMADYTNPEPSNHFSSTQTTPVHLSRQNSVELMYTPSANNITQSFPMTQRKLLQDPNSGQYFVVDMPVKVQTKTFFDPETGSYVQLPVQSLNAESSAMEVLKAPTLMLYHGFVPMPGATLAQQNSTANAVNPGYLDVFEPTEMGNNVDVYQKHHTMNEHLPQEDLDLDLGQRH